MSVYIIAEMAWSHTGSLEKALFMLDGASRSGADGISVHITDMPDYMVEDYRCVDGITLSDSADQNTSIYGYLNDINLSTDQWVEFNAQARKLNIDLIVMCNDRRSFEFSKKLNVSRYVLSAASFLESELITDIVKTNPDIILRTGGSTLDEVDRVVEKIFETNSQSKVCLLAGIQLYPTPVEELHLASLVSLAERFGQSSVSVGLADHIDGDHPFAIHLPALALGLGATILEKHITTDRKEKLEDYEAALGIEQFSKFVEFIRTSELAIGDGSLSYMEENESYRKYRMVTRKKIVAARDIEKGTTLLRDMLLFKRSDTGAQLDSLDQLVGSTLLVEKKCDQGVEESDVSSIQPRNKT